MASGGPLLATPIAPKKQLAAQTAADPNATGVQPTAGSTMPSTSAYQQTMDQFNQQPQPDPNTFIAMLWPHLTSHQKDLVKALMSNPEEQGEAPGAADEQEPAGQSTGQQPMGQQMMGQPTA